MASPSRQGSKRPYRARLQRPCDACRRRKICCVRDSVETQCSLCKMRDVPCTFVSAPNVRRRRRVSTSDPPHEPMQDVDASRSPTLLQDHSMQRQDLSNGLRTPATATEPETSPTTSTEWISQFVGLSGDQDPYILRHCFLQQNRYRHPDFACLRVPGYDWEEPAHFTGVPDGHLDPRPEWYPDRPAISSEIHAAMMEAFWTNVHSSYPLLDPQATISDAAESDVPLRGAVYSLAKQFTPQITAIEDWDTWSRFMFQALPVEARFPRLETAEAMLLWLQRTPKFHRAPTMPGLWSEVGSLVGILHTLGLHVDPTGWAIPQAQKRRRIRIANGIYILDKWLALGLGRPSYISSNDWSVPLPQQSDFVDAPAVIDHDGDPSIGKHMFTAMTALSSILADMLEAFYTMRAVELLKQEQASTLLSRLEIFETSLCAFNERHLAPLMRYPHENVALLDARGTVSLAYYTAQIVLYRAILRHLQPAHDMTGIVRDRARTVLTSTTQFLSGLTVSQTQAFWWSPISRINFAVIGSFMFSMLLTSTDEDQVEFWVGQIGRYRRLLDLHSASFDTARLAAKRLELLACVATGYGEESGEDPWNLRI